MEDREIDLRALMKLFWDSKSLIMTITLIFSISSVVLALYLPNTYKGEIRLAPNSDSGVNNSSMLSGGITGIASLAGLDFSSPSSNNVALGLEILNSRKFITDFVERRNILVPLMAAKEWDEQKEQLIIDSDIYDEVNNKWVREVSAPMRAKPSSWEYVEEFRSIFSIIEDDETGFITLTISHRSPEISAQWVTWLVKDINAEVRRIDVEEAQLSLNYLTHELEQTELASGQQIFYELMEQQTQKIMLANVRPEYVFRVIDPAVIPLEKSGPPRAIIAILGTLLGGALSLLIVVMIRSLKNDV